MLDGDRTGNFLASTLGHHWLERRIWSEPLRNVKISVVTMALLLQCWVARQVSFCTLALRIKAIISIMVPVGDLRPLGM